jgi:hypothetical protein
LHGSGLAKKRLLASKRHWIQRWRSCLNFSRNSRLWHLWVMCQIWFGILPFCPCRRTILYRNFWGWKSQYRVYFGSFLKQFSINFKWLAWPAPD